LTPKDPVSAPPVEERALNDALAKSAAIFETNAKAFREAGQIAESSTNTASERLSNIRTVLDKTLLSPSFHRSSDGNEIDEKFGLIRALWPDERVDKEPSRSRGDQAQYLRDHAILELVKEIRDPRAMSEIAEQLAGTLASPQLEDPERLIVLGKALTAMRKASQPIDGITAKGEKLIASLQESLKTRFPQPADVAGKKPEPLRESKTSDLRGISSVSSAFVTLAPLMDPRKARDFTLEGASALIEILEKENSKVLDARARSDLGTVFDALAALVDGMQPEDASVYATRTIKAYTKLLLKPAKRSPNDFSERNPAATDGDTLAKLARRMGSVKPSEGTADLIEFLEASLEAPDDVDPTRFAAVGRALAAMTAGIEQTAGIYQAARGTRVLLKGLQKPRKDSALSPGILGQPLVLLAAQLGPEARQNHFFGLSAFMLTGMLETPPEAESESFETRIAMTTLCGWLSPQELVSILKWPFCVGEAEKLILAELQSRKIGPFEGDVWKLVGLIKDNAVPTVKPAILTTPAERPTLEKALAELEGLIEKHQVHH